MTVSGRTLPELVRGLLGLAYVGGAIVHLVLWASNRSLYAEITPHVLFGWYRDLWTGVVLPNLDVLLPLLVLVEGAMAVAILSRGRTTKLGLAAGGVFNLCVAPLGFWWPTNVALAAVHAALLRVEFPESTIVRGASRIGRGSVR